jgi:hypothetical protein
MISSQCNKLRERATTLRQGRWSDGEDDATMMEQAADTIWELRCKLAGVVDQSDEIERLKAENVKLVDVLHEVEAEAVYAYHCLQQDCVTIANSTQHFFDKWWHAECELDRLKAENAKLRELVRKWYPHMLKRVGRDALEQWGQMDVVKELGIEVIDD